ncbi:PLP-dependent aminotransferase family protein [Hyalangium sp.]|uniref:MocR-like pyridoxine biosynthesis transcription factor PdxR n=1 Tax=Hyalangium sp. TaxID=2028555 RepID=UPI002D6B60BB|nr:PLP-dependent aminotransferase family protein [Hyalangium sp.]HYH99152.1 PLP-dependent aminotransferase family protein [Hyalangium sp.]
MRTWELSVPLDEASPTPLFVQIARALAEDIRRGRLKPGAPLPGSRALATTLHVHRNTVLAAYQELEAQGWISTAPARGTFVSTALPDVEPPARSEAPRARSLDSVGFPLDPPLESREPVDFPRGALVLTGGSPDVRLLPVEVLARAWRRAFKLGGQRLLDYAGPQGHPRLRAALAHMLASVRGLAATPDSLLVTRGSQGALYLAARALVRPGERIAVEALGYRPAWEAFRSVGAQLVPIPIDGEGIRVDRLETAARQGIRAVYLTPHHQYPTTVTLSPARRLTLLAWARAAGSALIEDDYDHEFHYDGRPVLPLASADRDNVVIYVGTLSKVLAPGLRVGFLFAPIPLIRCAASIRAVVDRQGDLVAEYALAELLEEGELQRHVRKMRGVYRSRRDALVEALRKELPDALEFSIPAGGMTLWARCAPGLDAAAWSERARDMGVWFSHGGQYTFDGQPFSALRLGFAGLKETELREAVRRMARARPRR